MRDELQIIEKIERYLNREFSPGEKAAFEREMADNPELREEVRLQQDILNGIDRAAWKDKIQRARRRYQWKQRFFKGGTFGIVILSVVLVWQLWPVKGRQQTASSRQAASTRQAGSGQPMTNPVTPPEAATDSVVRPGRADSGRATAFVPIGDTALAKYFATARDTAPQGGNPATPLTEADKNLPAQTFRIDAMQDTVIETRGGMVLSIPAGAFQQEDGQVVTGGIELVVREALDPASIIRAGLTSLWDGQLLESGGMFSVDASKNGKALKINPANGVYAEIPTDTVKPGMQLYTGKKLADGTIDWVKPRSLEHDLVAVDIRSLDFYPPRYLDSLRRWGYDSRDKRFTDSLYYSFAQFFAAGEPESGTIAVAQIAERRDTFVVTQDTAMPKDTVSPRTVLPCGINPAKIKTIWNVQFQNTLLATREFEERMPWIHRSENAAILDLYVKHLDRPLSTLDSMAANLLTGRKNKSLRDKFRSFYSRHDGRVRNGSRQFEKLKAYYELKERVFTEAIARTEREFRAKQADLDRVAAGRAQGHAIDSIVRMDRNFREEFSLNLASVCKQLGYNEQITQPQARRFYRVQLSLTGWCNIDRAVAVATREQATVVLTDDQTGKKAVISYLSLSIQVVKPEAYDRIYIYLIPDKLSSFIRLSGADGKFMGKLDDLMKYDLVCVAYKQEQAYYHYQANIGSGDHPPVTLDSIGKAELDRQLNMAGSMGQAADLQKENAYFRFEITDQARRRNVEKVWALQCMVMRLLFPCMLSSERACILLE